jgi:gliding motility-associated lipoprotein GldH
MNNKTIAFCIVPLILFVSCNHVYKEYNKESFPTYSWNDGQEITFSPKIESVDKAYQLTVALRHHDRMQMKALGITIKMISPSGKENVKDYRLKIKDSQNKNIANCAGDICDLESVVEESFKFDEAGEYKILITHNEKGFKVPGIMEVGLIVDQNN